jgi:small-conductance mechanosensitive channel
MRMSALLNRELLGNTILAWLIAAAIFVVVYAGLTILRRVLHGRFSRLAERTTTGVDDAIADIFGHTHRWFLLLVSLGVASAALTIDADGRSYIRMIVGAGVIIQLVIWGNSAINGWLRRESTARQGALGTLTAVAFLARLALWAILLLLLLDNFGIKVTTLLGALGVAGIAGALAAQSVLGDLFAAISIFLDKPFEVGDFIIFDDFLGTVSSVGLRSTRIASLSGEDIIISNSDLLKSRIRNYKRMQQRRIVFRVGVAYGTPREKVETIPSLIRAAVEEQKPVRFDRSHLQGYSDSSIDFETVYYVLDPSYNIYMDVQQAINLTILRRFEEEGIRFAHPVRVMRVGEGAAGDEPLPLAGEAAERNQ